MQAPNAVRGEKRNDFRNLRKPLCPAVYFILPSFFHNFSKPVQGCGEIPVYKGQRMKIRCVNISDFFMHDGVDICGMMCYFRNGNQKKGFCFVRI